MRALPALALLLGLLTGAARGTSTVADGIEKEPLPHGLSGRDNVITLSVPSAVVVILVTVVIIRTLVAGSTRLPVLLLAMQLVAVMVTGICTWIVAYVSTHDAIEEHTNSLLVTAGAIASWRATADLMQGVVLVETIAAQARSGVLPLLTNRSHYPGTHRRLLSLLRTVGRTSDALESIYFGNEHGELHGVAVVRSANGTSRKDQVRLTIGIGPRSCSGAVKGYGTWQSSCLTRSPELICESNDEVWDTCRHPACAVEGSAECAPCLTAFGTVQDDPQRCPGCVACATWVPGGLEGHVLPSDPAEWDLPPTTGRESGLCEPSIGAAWESGPGVTVVQGYYSNGSAGRRWAGGPAINADCFEPYDPRVRPWYRREEGVGWSGVYKFFRVGSGDGVVELGITVAAAVRGVAPSGGAAAGYTAGVPKDMHATPWQGVVGADFSFTTISRFLVHIRPTANSVVLISDTEGTLCAGSLDPAEMTAAAVDESGQSELAPVHVLHAEDWRNRSDLAEVFPRIVRKFGSLTEATRHRAILQGGDSAVLNAPIAVDGGLTWLMAVNMPYEDILDDTQKAFFLSLIMAMVISFGCGLLVSGVVAFLLRPMRTFSLQLHEVAQMDLDRLPPISWSIMTEVSDMQADFLVMVDSLKRYRSFLPQAVLECREDRVQVEAPTGTIAVLFSDIVGSTKLWEADAEAMAEALESHNGVIRAQINTYSGYEVKTIGDSFMVSFKDPADAVLCAIAVQEGLLGVQWPDCGLASVHDLWAPQRDAKGALVWNGIAVRIGIGYGEVQTECNPVTGRCDYRGRSVNLSSRLESSAPHGCVQLSAQCHDAVQGQPRIKHVDFHKLPQKDLKGIGPVQTYIAMSPGLMQRLPIALGAATNPLTPCSPPGRHDSMRKRNSLVRDSTGRSPATPQPSFLDLGGRQGTGVSATSAGRQPSDKLPGATREGPAEKGVGKFAALLSAKSNKANGGNREFQGIVGLINRGRELAEVREGSVAVVRRLDAGITETPCGKWVAAEAEMSRSTSAAVTCAVRTQGKVLCVAGSQAYVCWNLISDCAPHAMQALTFASIILQSASSVGIGMAAGPLCRGNVGSARHKFYTVWGCPVLCALLAAFEAGQQHVDCLACYSPQPPDELRPMLCPVDTWGAPDSSGKMASISIEQPAMHLIRRRQLGDESEVGTEELAALSLDQTAPNAVDMLRARAHYELALAGQGAAEALSGLEALAARPFAKHEGHPLSARRLARLKEMLSKHVNDGSARGAAYIRRAPFVSGSGPCAAGRLSLTPSAPEKES
eukprot:TRINITY_DN43499_c1_g1_i1.p1 TRINITY_DN43499_c1_g1~~TRINITY_DN43499_c1_g1_i1.p1  ORF type:complete len:1314 (+),score=387.41 TRINITY_DN43499_c1_g1_i1:76-3942(+)